MEHRICKVISVEIAGPHQLRVGFDDGLVREIDFLPSLAGKMLAPLRDPALFRQVQIDPEAHTLVWPTGADFDPAMLHDWPEYAVRSMKPGRKLLEQGAGSCTDAEILAILLGSGGPGYSALDSANALLDKYGTLVSLMNRQLDEIARIRGIKAVRAIRLAAAYELCQRLLKEISQDT